MDELLLSAVLWGDREGAATLRVPNPSVKTVTDLKLIAGEVLVGPPFDTPRQAKSLKLFDLSDDSVVLTDARFDNGNYVDQIEDHVLRLFPKAKALGPFEMLDEIFIRDSATSTKRSPKDRYVMQKAAHGIIGATSQDYGG
ncbi:hypothetical protein HDV00_007349 [Rhizophlyctis rosea]|nr:hypothetical protein HDV00_007349 [Rhizophlyctis rosea]